MRLLCWCVITHSPTASVKEDPAAIAKIIVLSCQTRAATPTTPKMNAEMASVAPSQEVFDALADSIHKSSTLRLRHLFIERLLRYLMPITLNNNLPLPFFFSGENHIFSFCGKKTR